MRNVSRILSIFLFAANVFGQQQPEQEPPPDPDVIAHRAMDILGGGGAWDHARYFSFTYTVIKDGKVVATFPQKWDRFTGEYEVSGRRPDGLPFEATINVITGMGHGSIQGRTVTDNEDFRGLYELAYRRFANDVYWLLMPLKMFDKGVHRAYDGKRTDSCGHTWDLLKLTFEPGVGLTPGDVYWPWINRDTGMVEEWDMKLQAMAADAQPVQVMFHDYRRVAGLLISLRREVVGQNQIVRLDDLQILPDVPKGAFKEYK